MATATQLDTDMSFWAPGTRHYSLDTGDYLAVTVDVGLNSEATELLDQALDALDAPTVASGRNKIVVSPTVAIACTDEGVPTDLTPVATFAPGTTHEKALEDMGHVIA